MARKTTVFEGWSWLKFNNLGLVLGTNLKFYTSLSIGLKLKVRKVWGQIPTFVEVTEEKLVGGGLSWIGLSRCISKARVNSESVLTFSASSLYFLQNKVIICPLYQYGYTAGGSAPYNPSAAASSSPGTKS